MWIAESYAKINLGLNILSTAADMNLDYKSGLCFIDWRDRFEVKQAPKMEVKAGNKSTKKAIKQAIGTLKRYVGLKNNYQIKVEKRIPSEAGLGDVSSNTALTLRMLNKIEQLNLSDKDLIDLGINLERNIA